MRIHPLVLTFGFVLMSADLMASGRSPSPVASGAVQAGSKGLSIRQFARTFGFRKVNNEKDHFRLEGDLHTLLLYRGSRRSVVNGTLVWMNQPVRPVQGDWFVDAVDVQNTFAPLFRPASSLAGQGFQVVVLDPGHGGQDSGARSSSGLQEKDVALDIARRVRSLLQAQGVRVFLTRHDDRFLELEERPRRAGRWDADVFVSIHANSARTQAQGVETFVLSLPGSLSTHQDPNTKPSATPYPGNVMNEANVALGYHVHHALRALPGAQDRGVKRARFSVLRTAPCPAALVEVGFLSHPVEERRLRDPAHRDRIARSIARGIDNYLREVKTATVNLQTSKTGN